MNLYIYFYKVFKMCVENVMQRGQRSENEALDLSLLRDKYLEKETLASLYGWVTLKQCSLNDSIPLVK